MAMSADILIKRAVSDYLTTARPSRREMKLFSDLFCGLYAHCTAHARLQCADSLAVCSRLPTQVSTLLAHDDPLIAARFLRHSPAISSDFNSDDLTGMTLSHKRMLARHDALPHALADTLHAIGDPDITYAIDLRRAAQCVDQPEVMTLIDTILDAAQRRDVMELSDHLAAALSLSVESTFFLLADKQSHHLMIALKHLNLSPEQAWQVHRNLGHALAERGYEAFAANYETRASQACAAQIEAWTTHGISSPAQPIGAVAAS